MAAVGDYDFATLEASGVADVAFSPDETLLYAAMRNGDINVYDVATRQKIAIWHVGVQLGGISVSEDGSFLLVVERQPAANTSTFYRVDTGSGAALTVSTTGHAFRDVEIVDGDTAVLTGGGTGWSQHQILYNLQTGAFSALANSVDYSGWGTVLAEDGHLTLFAEPGNGNGPLFLFDDRTNTIVAKGDNYQTIDAHGHGYYTGSNFGSQAISEAAGLVLQFAGRNVLVYDLGLKYLRYVPVGGLIDGIVFDPTGDFFYIYEIESGYLAKYDVASWTRVDQYYVGTSTWHNDIGYGSQLLINADGTRITIVDTDMDIGKLRMVDLTGAGYFIGTSGADTFAGAKGDDIYVVDHAGDVVIENPGEGTDEVRTSLATYSLLGSWIENLAATSDVAHDFRGSAGNNALTGGGGNDLLRLNDGGDDSAFGGAGNDILYFGAAFTGTDVANGGADRDVLILQGNYGLTLSATNLAGIESISLQSGARTTWGDTANNFYDYVITMDDLNVGGGEQLIVNGQSLRAGEDFSFDGSAETGDGKYLVYGGHGADNFTGGAGNDVFFFEGARFGPDDKVEGGAGRDAIVISSGSGVNRFEFGDDALTGIESISLNNRFTSDPSQKPSYELVLGSGNVAPGATLIVNGSSLSDRSQSVSVDGSAVEGNLILLGGFGDDILTGGDGADRLQGGEGIDVLTGGGGADTFRYAGPYDSTSQLPDRILDFVSGTDRIDLGAIDADVFAAGNQAFRWIGASAFAGTGAASAGELRAYEHNGDWFVEGDMDGNGAADLVIQLTAPVAPIVEGDFLL